jgi:hypothetical protein
MTYFSQKLSLLGGASANVNNSLVAPKRILYLVSRVEKKMNGEKSNKKDDGKLGVMKLNDHKAGMDGLDVTRINQIIEEASKGSKFYLHKQKTQERIDKK